MYLEIMWVHIPPRYLYPSSGYQQEYRIFYRLPVLWKLSVTVDFFELAGFRLQAAGEKVLI